MESQNLACIWKFSKPSENNFWVHFSQDILGRTYVYFPSDLYICME
jgi:hypothetical protein